MVSRSRSTYRGAWSQGNASRICCMVHSCVGCSVTPKCTTRRRSCDRATKTNRIRKVAVGTVKKIDAYGLRQMIGQEGSPSLGRRFAGPKQIPGHRILRHRNPQFEQFSVNAGVRPTRGWLVACAESGHECSLQLLAFRDGAAISWSNARRTLYGANGGPCRAEPSADIAANRTRIGTTNPQQPVAAVEAQATWRLPLQNRELVTERKDLRLQGSAGSKTGGRQSKKSDEKRAHRCSHHDLTNDRNFCVFRSDGVFSNHRACGSNSRAPMRGSHWRPQPLLPCTATSPHTQSRTARVCKPICASIPAT